MITTTDLANILYRASRAFGIPVYQAGNPPKGYVDERGRIVIHSRPFTLGRIWNKSYAEVNIFIADTPQGQADLIKLNQFERMAHDIFDDCDSYDQTPYRYSVSSTMIADSTDLKAHYVNVKVLFEALNTSQY